jgi:putative transposase
MATSQMCSLICMIARCCKASLALAIELDARYGAQLEVRGADEAKLVICDQAIDITYIRLKSGWLYLVAILDWYSRYVISWALDDTLELPFVLDAVDRALAMATPTIWNSDQGSHYTSQQLISKLEAAGAKISMDGRGRAHDNIFTERLWRSVKYEEVYLHEYGSPREARIGIAQYMHFYNTERPHQALDYRRPVEVYRGG